MIDKAILSINPNATFTINADDIDQITWLNETTPISKSDIQTKVAELQTAYDNKQYQRDRKTQYGTWREQMEMIYKDQKNGTTTFKDHCDKVRSDNPKE
jgi:hypothetical protein